MIFLISVKGVFIRILIYSLSVSWKLSKSSFFYLCCQDGENNRKHYVTRPTLRMDIFTNRNYHLSSLLTFFYYGSQEMPFDITWKTTYTRKGLGKVARAQWYPVRKGFTRDTTVHCGTHQRSRFSVRTETVHSCLKNTWTRSKIYRIKVQSWFLRSVVGPNEHSNFGLR